MNNNGHNNSCDFSETLVSYLYGETSAAESDKFKSHLAQCAHCAEELAGFGVMRSSLAEWKKEEFAPMSAPTIELPQRSDPVPVILTDEPVSWLDGIRAFFTPKVALTAAGFAAILICVGLMFAYFNSRNSGNENIVAANNQPKDNIKKVTVPENSSTTAGANEKEVAAKTALFNDKNSAKTPKPVHEYAGYQMKNNVAVNKIKPQDAPKQIKQKPESLDTKNIYEETEDDSLRLADLFAEADTKY